MTTTRQTTLTLLVLCALSMGGCEEPIETLDCTEIGCSSTLTVMLPTLENGDYQINLDMNLFSAECTFQIPIVDIVCSTEDGLYVNADGDLYANLPMVEQAELDETISVYIINPFEDSDIPNVDVDATIDWSDPYYPNGEECDEFACFTGTVML